MLAQAGQDTIRMPDPGRGRRKALPALLHDTPAIAILVDTFEPRVHRSKRRQRAYYPGAKRCHTLKSPVAAYEESAGAWTSPRACRGSAAI